MDGFARKSGTLTAAAMMVVVMATPLLAQEAEVTQGSFQSFASGAGDPNYADVAGQATMIRTASGATIVVINATGLAPGETYGSHVHRQACADGDAGGHYSFGFQVPGGALDGSEIWPGPFAANPAGHVVGKAKVDATAGATAVSVVIHAPGGAKIACADLS